MKIDAAFSALPLSPRAIASRAAVPGFQVPSTDAKVEPARFARVAQTAHVNLVSAIIGDEDKRQRRRQRHGHAAGLLDRLDRLALGLVSGRVESGVVEGLAGALQAGPEASDDPALEALIEAVELRAAVEMAKIKAFKRGRSGP